MNNKMTLFIIVLFIAIVILVKVMLGTVALLFSKVGIVLVVLGIAGLYYFYRTKIKSRGK